MSAAPKVVEILEAEVVEPDDRYEADKPYNGPLCWVCSEPAPDVRYWATIPVTNRQVPFCETCQHHARRLLVGASFIAKNMSSLFGGKK